MHAWINITHPGFSGRQDIPDDGDQWVSWEQMVAMLRAKGEAEGRAALLAREVVELRGEVAKLKSLESMRSRLCASLGLPADSAPETVAEAVKARRVVVPEHLLHDLAMAAWDAGAEAGIVWDPDAPLEKRGIVLCTPEDGLENSRANFARHGSGSPNSDFCRALQAIREHARAIPADRVLGDGMVAVDPKSGAGRILSERMRQISHEGWTREHDMHHSDGELALAAACYAWPPPRPLPVKQAWPWERGAWKPTAPEAIPVVCECRTAEECWHGIVSDDAKIAARQRDLEKAGALIAAEIDRLSALRANQGGAAT